MKTLVFISAALALLLLANFFAPAVAQDSLKDNTPTFYHLVPGTYVNGWPRFTIHYPKEWVERIGRPEEAFKATVPGPVPFPGLTVPIGPNPAHIPLDKFGDMILPFYRTNFQDVTIVSDEPYQLRDRTLAREVEVKMVLNGSPLAVLNLGTIRNDVWCFTAIWSPLNGKIGDDLRAVAHSFEFQPGFDEPVKVPPDIQAFLDKMNEDVLSHDIKKVMSHYSDRFLHSGVRKGEAEQRFKQLIGSTTSAKAVVTEFVPAGDRANLTGFLTSNLGRFPMGGTSMIKENGEWKLYGNQRDALP